MRSLSPRRGTCVSALVLLASLTAGTAAAAGPAGRLSTTKLVFPDTLVGTTSGGKSVTVTSVGSGPLSISGVTITGLNPTEFLKSSDGCTGKSLAVGTSCSILVKFKPAAGGLRTASLRVAANAADAPYVAVLNGTGTGPKIRLSTTALSFGQVAGPETSAARRITVTSIGSVALKIGTVAIGGTHKNDYLLSGETCSGKTLAYNATCTVDVKFKPVAIGTRTGWLAITNNAGGSPHKVVLSGVGIDTTPPALTVETDLEKPPSVPVGTDVAVRLVGESMEGTATDNFSGIGTVNVEYTGTQKIWNYTATVSCDTSRTSCTWSAPVPNLTGWYTAEVTTSDLAGKAAQPSRFTLLVAFAG